MITKLTLKQFKNFDEAEFTLGPLTTLIGSNAAGKTNIRDALQFLQGVGLGYNLAEIMGGKYVGGIKQWAGVRGGANEISYLQADTFTLNVEIKVDTPSNLLPTKIKYSLEVAPKNKMTVSAIIKESLYGDDKLFFEGSLLGENKLKLIEDMPLSKNLPKQVQGIGLYYPLLPKIKESIDLNNNNLLVSTLLATSQYVIDLFSNIQIFDLNPESMRIPAIPGETTIGSRGENLASALQALCETKSTKQALIEWVRELTPMDVYDFEFEADPGGHIWLILIEKNKQRTSAYAASDGTLRFLGVIAALLNSQPASVCFFEELDNGLHPNRLYLLLELIERKTHEKNMQVITTTHSPQFLQFLSLTAQQNTSLVYRLPNTSQGHIKPIVDIPHVKELIKEQSLAELHDSGWFEDAVFFLDEAGAE